jgi:pyridoxal phosphate enzyme (YggS family)
MTILDNLAEINNNIAVAAEKCNRQTSDIKLLAVSKTFPVSAIEEAIDTGLTLFGENKVQEAKQKTPQLPANIVFHLIGHLQSNKAKDAVNLFDVIHSIDKITTAEAVNKEAEEKQKIQKILVQINASAEETKSGIEPDYAIEFMAQILKMKNIEPLGLMTMAEYTDEEKKIHKTFEKTRLTLDKINKELHIDLKELSMGMSSDYIIAIEEGSTIVRIGSLIFGNR